MHSPLLLAFALSALVVSAAARAETATPSSVTAPPAETIQLANGLRVLLAPDPSARLVSIVVSYAAGAADDPNGRRGLAHLAEHIVARRTQHIAHPMRTLESAGGWRFNATTSIDATTYFESIPPERLETALWLESDRMGYVAGCLTRTTLEEEREVVRIENRDRTVDGMLGTVWATVVHEMFPGWHPYSTANDGAADLDSIDERDVRAFLETWYTPRNATLAVAGRFDREATLALIRRYFEALPSAAPPSRPALPKWETPAMQLAVTAAVPGSQVLVAWRTPALGEKDDAALDLAAAMLSGRGNARLERSLVATQLATAVQARQKSQRRESVFYIRATLAPGASPEELAQAVQATINGLARDVTAVELERSKRLWRDAAAASIETPWGRASRLVTLAKLGAKSGPEFDWGFERYEGIGVSDVATAVSKWLGPAHRIAMSIVADRAAPRSGSLVARDTVSQ